MKTHDPILDMLRTRLRGARGPAGIAAERDGTTVTLTVATAAVLSNMQTDAAAADGWALVLLSLDPQLRVVIDVADHAGPLDAEERTHVHRFGYRLGRFAEVFAERVSLGTRLRALADRTGDEVAGGILNIAKTGRAPKQPAQPGRSEKAIELQLTAHEVARGAFMRRFGLERLCLQFPVGLFAGTVKHAHRLFPGGGARIDLIGVGADGAVHLFELKKKLKNAKVGALSELMFYSWVLADARGSAPRFRFDGGRLDAAAQVRPADVLAAPRIVAHLLTHGDFGSATGPHGLIDRSVFDLLNDATARRGWPITYRLSSWDGLGVVEDDAA